MNHGKKMIAPIVISLSIVLYYVFIIVLFLCVPGIPFIARAFMILIPFLLAAVMIGVLISRIKEIQGGEEDDLSKY